MSLIDKKPKKSKNKNELEDLKNELKKININSNIEKEGDKFVLKLILEENTEDIFERNFLPG